MKKKLLISISVLIISIFVYIKTTPLVEHKESKVELDLTQYGIPVEQNHRANDLEIIALNYKKADNNKQSQVEKTKTRSVKETDKSDRLHLKDANNAKTNDSKTIEPQEHFVSYETVETKGAIAYNTIEESTDQLDEGQVNLLRAGEDGVYKIIDKYEVVDGARTLISSEKVIIKEALSEIIQVGIRKEQTSNGSYDSSVAYETLTYVNELRAQLGLPKLNWNESLAHASQQRSMEIAQAFSHTRPNGSAWYTVDERIMAENIAYGQKSARAVIDSFNNSSVHRENMMSAKWTSMYVSLYIKDGVYYWVQHFS